SGSHLASRTVTTIDVAGVGVALRASDHERLDALLDALAGFAATMVRPSVEVVIDGAAVAPPAGVPDAGQWGCRFWHDEGRVVVAVRSGVLHATPSAAELHVQLDDLDIVEDLVSIALAWLLAPLGRYVVHGAAIARDDVGLLVLGEPRAGKST